MLWGVAGVSLLLLSAVFRLGAVALQTLRMDLDWWHWVACGISLVFLGITEGYMAFQRGYSPRVAARALHLKDNPQLSGTWCSRPCSAWASSTPPGGGSSAAGSW